MQLYGSPWRLAILTESPDQPDGVVEVTLTPEKDQTVLVIEDRGVPLARDRRLRCGATGSPRGPCPYVAGGDRCDARTCWQELRPAYQELAAELT